MKVGDYVRNKYGIAKVIDIKNNNGIEVLVFDKNICFLVNKETGKIKDDKLFNQLPIIESIDINKIKSSPRIIDLIQVGDYVNGHYVEYVETTPNEEVYKVIRTSTCDGMNGETLEIYKEDIKSIVTKEQFKEMEYNL